MSLCEKRSLAAGVRVTRADGTLEARCWLDGGDWPRTGDTVLRKILMWGNPAAKRCSYHAWSSLYHGRGETGHFCIAECAVLWRSMIIGGQAI